MLRQLTFILVLISISLGGNANHSGVNHPPHFSDPSFEGYFGDAEYFGQIDQISLVEAQNLEPSKWTRIDINDANLGFDSRHFWFRVPLKNIYSAPTPWFLHINYPLLDYIDVYLLADDVIVQQFHTGDAYPFEQRPINRPGFVFPLTIDSNKDYSLYIHAHTAGSFQLSLSLQTESHFWQSTALENAASAAFYAILVSMLFYNLIIFFIVRARSYLFYLMYLFSFTLFMASMQGWAYQFLWPNSPQLHELSVAFLIGPVIIFSALFSSTFLKLPVVRPDFYRILLTLVWVAIAYSVATLIVPYVIIIKVGATLAILVTTAALFFTYHEWVRNRSREVMLFIIAWTTVLFGFMLYSGQKFGILPINIFTEHAIEIGALLEVILLALALADRINSERKKRLETQQKMLDVQIIANRELDNKVQERTAELEQLNGELQSASITDSLTQIKNRRYFDYKLSNEFRRAHRDKTPLSLMLIDIDFFKKFNDQYGHQAGDDVLKKVATRIQEITHRPGDTVARYGGEEFTVLLSDTSLEGALLVAECIRNSIEKMKLEWEGNQLSLTISIGLATTIPTAVNAEQGLLKEADTYLYMAKANGRNQVIHKNNALPNNNKDF